MFVDGVQGGVFAHIKRRQHDPAPRGRPAQRLVTQATGTLRVKEACVENHLTLFVQTADKRTVIAWRTDIDNAIAIEERHLRAIVRPQVLECSLTMCIDKAVVGRWCGEIDDAVDVTTTALGLSGVILCSAIGTAG